jgi:hypothetical protein
MTMNDFAPGQDYNAEYHKNLITNADNNAKNAYQASMANYEGEKVALERAKQAWKETVDRATMTGYFEGQATMPTQQWWAEQFGNWAAPTAGQQTLSAQQQAFAQQQALAEMYGQGYANFGAVPGGQQTLSAQEQAYTQWLRQQQEQRLQQAQQQDTANKYLTLLSGLRGPADWAKYQEVLGATPGGMRDLVGMAMGQYVPGGGATTGAQPQAANLNTLYGQVTGGGQYGNYQPGGGGANWPVASFTPMGSNQAAYAPNNQIAQPEGRASVYAQPTTNQESLFSPAAQAFQATGNGTNTMGAQQNQYNLPAPNQIAAQSWKNMAPSQQQMLLGQYEAAGWHKPDVEALLAQSLPRYGSNAPSAGTWRLR